MDAMTELEMSEMLIRAGIVSLAELRAAADAYYETVAFGTDESSKMTWMKRTADSGFVVVASKANQVLKTPSLALSAALGVFLYANDHSVVRDIAPDVQHTTVVDIERTRTPKIQRVDSSRDAAEPVTEQDHINLALAEISAIASAISPSPQSLQESLDALSDLELITQRILEASQNATKSRLQSILDAAAGSSFPTVGENAALVRAINHVRKSLRLGLQLIHDDGSLGPRINISVNRNSRHGSFQAVTTTGDHSLVYIGPAFPCLRIIA